MAIGGETIGQAYIRILADGKGLSEDIKRDLEKNNKGSFEKAGREHGKAYSAGFDNEVRRHKTLDGLKRDLHEGRGRFEAEGVFLGSAMMKGLQKELKKSFGGATGGKVFDNLKKDLESGALSVDDLGSHLRNLRSEVSRTDRETTRHTGRISNSFHGMADKIGKLFGRGSRNDFLNLFGGFVSLAPRIVAGLFGIGGAAIAAAGGIARFFRAQQDAFKAGQTIWQIILNIIGALTALAFEAAPLAVAAVVGIGAIFGGLAASLGILASGLVLISGLVLALAGSLAFALAGGITAVIGALLPFAAAFGVAAIAISGLGKKSKIIKDIKKDWKDLQKETAKELFGSKQGGIINLQTILRNVKPVILAVAGAVRDVLHDMAVASKGKPFQDLMKNLAKILPPLIKQLSRIGGNFLLGIGQAFVAAQPLIEDFLKWLEDVSKKWVKFTKDPKGKKKAPITDFFEKAQASAKIVGPLILEIIGLIGDLFGAGKTSGDNVFTKILNWVRQIRGWLADPANAGAIDQWFVDAETVAGKIGGIVTAVSDLIAALDTPQNRTLFTQILELVPLVIRAIQIVVKWVEIAWIAFQTVWGQIKSVVETTVAAIQAQFNLLVDIMTPIVLAIFAPWVLLYQWLVGNSLVPDLVNAIVDWFGRLPGMILAALGDLLSLFAGWLSPLLGFAIQTVTDIVNAFANLAGKILNVLGDLATGFGLWLFPLVGIAVQTAKDIVTPFIDLAGQIIRAMGDIATPFAQWLAPLPQTADTTKSQLVTSFSGLGGQMVTGAGPINGKFSSWLSGLPGKARGVAGQVGGSFKGLAGKLISGAGNLAGRFGTWASGLPGRARGVAGQVGSAFSNLSGKMITRAGNLSGKFSSWASSVPGKAKKLAGDISKAFTGLAAKAFRTAGSLTSAMDKWSSGVAGKARKAASDIVSAFHGLAGKILRAIGPIVIKPTIKMPTITRPTVTAKVIVPKILAAGGVFNQPTLGMFGEAGPEAVVPLRRPLSQVDPAVRALSAFAQGLTPPSGGGGGNAPGKLIEVGGITINTPTENPRAVASEVINRMTAAAYI